MEALRTVIMDNTQEVDLGQLKPQLLLKQKVHTTMGINMVIKQEVQELHKQKRWRLSPSLMEDMITEVVTDKEAQEVHPQLWQRLLLMEDITTETVMDLEVHPQQWQR